jgi:hypothetical protein
MNGVMLLPVIKVVFDIVIPGLMFCTETCPAVMFPPAATCGETKLFVTSMVVPAAID